MDRHISTTITNTTTTLLPLFQLVPPLLPLLQSVHVEQALPSAIYQIYVDLMDSDEDKNRQKKQKNDLNPRTVFTQKRMTAFSQAVRNLKDTHPSVSSSITRMGRAQKNGK